MKKMTIKLLGVMTALVLVTSVYSPGKTSNKPDFTQYMHGDYGG